MKNNVSHICFSLVGIGIFTFYRLVLDFIIVGSFLTIDEEQHSKIDDGKNTDCRLEDDIGRFRHIHVIYPAEQIHVQEVIEEMSDNRNNNRSIKISKRIQDKAKKECISKLKKDGKGIVSEEIDAVHQRET